MKKIKLLLSIICVAAVLCSCKKDNEFLPPDWNYVIPETPLTEDTNLGAYYVNRTTSLWAEGIKDHPLLNSDEDGTQRVYTSALDGVLTQQCKWADQAGINFFIFPWNNASEDKDLIAAYEYYRLQDQTKVKIVVNYNFAHLKLDAADMKLTDSGAALTAMVSEFKGLYATLFSKDYYFHLADGRPVILIPGEVSVNADYSLFVSALKNEMKAYTKELQAADPSVSDNALNFYMIGEVKGNWLPPQRNEEVSKYLDANLDKQWYPQRYYERWYSLYPYTDMAWQNWRNYAENWGNDFVPCIYPEYYTSAVGYHSVERSEYGYSQFCNVAKRNIGKNRVVILNSWNEFENSLALEPTTEYGETTLEWTRKFLKL